MLNGESWIEIETKEFEQLMQNLSHQWLPHKLQDGIEDISN